MKKGQRLTPNIARTNARRFCPSSIVTCALALLTAAGAAHAVSDADLLRAFGTPGLPEGVAPVPPEDRLVGLAYCIFHQEGPWRRVWGTPELGFYSSSDRAVIRQHAAWIQDAGVDFVWVDWSNNIDYIPGKTENLVGQSIIERSTAVLFQEYAALESRPKISIFLGVTGAHDAVADGRLQRKADQVYDQYVSHPKYGPMLQEYLGKPLLVVYADTPSCRHDGLPDWNDDRFTVRWMTGFVTEQHSLQGKGLISKYGYWSWEERGKQTVTIHEGSPESIVVVASWRMQGTGPDDADYVAPGLRRDGQTFHEQWARARALGPKFAMVVTWNEWVTWEQPSAENSKDLEPSKKHGRKYLEQLKAEIATFKGH
jgi:hypothetical protein